MQRPLVHILLIAAAYYASGLLGLYLAIPPGFATAVWPPSGLALAALLVGGVRRWPGILIGSFLLNSQIALDATNTASAIQSLLIAMVMASGAALQAVLGHRLVAARLTLPTALERPRDIGLLMFWGGVVACVTNATAGTGVLLAAGKLTLAALPYHWATWWGGDTIGVLVFTPVLLLVLAGPQVSRARKLIVAAAIAIAFALTVYLFFAVTRWEQERTSMQFRQAGSEMKSLIEKDLVAYQNILLSIERFYSASDYVSDHEFRTFTEGFFAQYPGLRSLSWNARVTDAERAQFEATMRRETGTDYIIRDRTADDQLIPAPHRLVYFPVTYVATVAQPRGAYGYDSYGDDPRNGATRRETLDKARDGGKLEATGRVSLVHDESHAYGLLFYYPIYRKNMPVATVAERRAALQGFATAVFTVPGMVQSSFSGSGHGTAHGPAIFDFVLSDRAPDGTETLLYDSRTPNHKEPLGEMAKSGLSTAFAFPVAGRVWQLTFIQRPTTHTTWSLWLVLVGGLLFSGLLSAFLLIVTGRTDTVQRLVEEKTREIGVSERQLRLLIRHTPAAVAMFDRQMRYIMTSERWLADYHLEGKAIIGRSHYDIFPEIRQMVEWMTIHQRALRGEIINIDEELWQRPDGKTDWVKSAIHPWMDAEGAIGGIVMFTEVITERKLHQQALKASEENFRAAMEHAPIGMALVALDGTWIKVNEALCHIIGYGADELQGNNYQYITHPEDLPKIWRVVKQMMAGKFQSWQMEKRYFHKSGRVIWVSLNLSLVHRPDGTANYFIAQIQDITERKQIEQMKNEFISTVSHELRTPLTSIRGSLGLLGSGAVGDMTEKAKNLIAIAYKNSERLVRIINDILDIEKIQSGKMEIRITPVEVEPFLKQAVEANQSYGEKYGVYFIISAMAEPLTVLADADRLMQVMSNLLSNAAKFSPRGSSVTIAVKRMEKHARFYVRDSGCGIPDEFRKNIFDKFVQADNSTTRRHEGTGLGLSITRTLVEAMHGTIDFMTQIGRGTSFYFDLPLAADSLASLQVKPEVNATTTPNYRPAILHVEEDRDFAGVIVAMLQEKADVVPVGTLHDAEMQLHQRRFDLMIIDTVLPDGNGHDFLLRLPRILDYKLPVMILSAREATQAMRALADIAQVKSRLSEGRIAEMIFRLLHRNRHPETTV